MMKRSELAAVGVEADDAREDVREREHHQEQGEGRHGLHDARGRRVPALQLSLRAFDGLCQACDASSARFRGKALWNIGNGHLKGGRGKF